MSTNFLPLTRPLSRLLLAGALIGLTGCVPAAQRASGWFYPLPRHQPNDGLAVVTRPEGAGLHIWLDTYTANSGQCSPRWNPDAARLRGGNGATPSSSGRAPRQEFYAAMARGPVRWQLRRQFAALCRQKAPQSRFIWREPPRQPQDFRPPPLPPLEVQDLLRSPGAIRRAEKQLLGLPLTPADYGNDRPPRPPNGP